MLNEKILEKYWDDDYDKSSLIVTKDGLLQFYQNMAGRITTIDEQGQDIEYLTVLMKLQVRFNLTDNRLTHSLGKGYRRP